MSRAETTAMLTGVGIPRLKAGEDVKLYEEHLEKEYE